jgi:hypothetical protein
MRNLIGIGIFGVVLSLAIASCAKDADPVSPSGSTATSFAHDVYPLFNANGCLGCHGGHGNLVLESVSSILRGGIHGPVIIAGKSDSSALIRKLSATPPFGDRMPVNRAPLTDGEVTVIKKWIDEGAKDN